MLFTSVIIGLEPQTPAVETQPVIRIPLVEPQFQIPRLTQLIRIAAVLGFESFPLPLQSLFEFFAHGPQLPLKNKVSHANVTTMPTHTRVDTTPQMKPSMLQIEDSNSNFQVQSPASYH
jgi:hypothetical protein